MPLPTLRIFVSSPGDVAEERVITGRVLQRIADRFAAVVTLESIFWEHEPLLATDTFQAQITLPSETDVFICILWSRLGTRLPKSLRRPDGSTYQSGTEFEFEDAFESFRRRRAPDLIVYRKTAEPLISLKDRAAVRAALAQSELLDEFIARWFHGADGTLIAAFHPFRETSEFEEHLETHLLKLIGARARRLGVSTDDALQTGPATWTAGSPYRGLEAFDFEHEPIFFGRTRAVSGVLRALQEQAAAGRPFVLVLGGSGSGKSSLVRAGVLPMLTRPGVVAGTAVWRRCVLRPSDGRGDLWLTLATALLRPEAVPEIATTELDPAKVAALLRDEPQRILDLIQQALDRPAATAGDGGTKPSGEVRLVLVLDQLEEVFTLDGVTADHRRDFFRLVEEMTRRGVWILATLRSDFYHRCAELPELARLKEGKGQFDLLPPTPSEIAAIIRQPAVAAGLRFEQNEPTCERLDELLCDAAAANPESLPLLEFTLDELYKRRSERHVLMLQAYRVLGGLEGALATRAAEVFGALPPPVQARLPRVFRQLVTLSTDENAAPARKPAALADLTSDPESAAFVDAFVHARLLSTKQGADGTPQAEITHEALLTRWPPLRDWLTADRELLLIRSRVAAAAELWVRHRRSADRLLPAGQPLHEALRLQKAGFDLTRAENDLIAASSRRSRFGRRVRRGAVATLLVLTLAAIVFGILAEWNRRRADEAAKTADNQKKAAEHQTELAKAATTEAQRQARINVIERLAAQSEAASTEFPQRRLLLAVEAVQMSLGKKETPIPAATQALHNALGNIGGKPLVAHDSIITSVAFSPDGRWLATGSWGETARLWDLAADDPAAAPRVLRGHEDRVTSAAFSTDGRWLATGSFDGTARLWDLKADDPAAALRVLRGHEQGVSAVAFSPDGRWLATGSEDKTARLWDLKADDPAAAPRVLRGHKLFVKSVAFSPDGRWLATGSWDETARLWDLKANDPAAAPRVLRGHEGPVTSVAFSPDGRWLATGSEDHTARLWDLEANDPAAAPRVLRGHEKAVSSVAFSPDGRWLATGSWDETARLWDLKAVNPTAAPPIFCGPVRGAAHGGPDALHSLAAILGGGALSVTFSSDGRWLAIGSWDQTARLWNLEANDSAAPRVLRGSVGGAFVGSVGVIRGSVLPVAFSPDGRWLATGSTDQSARLWDLDDPAAAPRVLRGHEGSVTSVAFSPDGRWLATTDGSVRLWPLQIDDLLKLARATVGRNLTQDEWQQYFPGDPYHKTFPDLPGPAD